MKQVALCITIKCVNDDILKKAEEVINEIIEITKEKTDNVAILTKTVDY